MIDYFLVNERRTDQVLHKWRKHNSDWLFIYGKSWIKIIQVALWYGIRVRMFHCDIDWCWRGSLKKVNIPLIQTSHKLMYHWGSCVGVDDVAWVGIKVQPHWSGNVTVVTVVVICINSMILITILGTIEISLLAFSQYYIIVVRIHLRRWRKCYSCTINYWIF